MVRNGRSHCSLITKILLVAVLVCGLWGLLQWQVRTSQGINYEVTQRTLPLSLKLVGFVYRDMECRHLASTLTRGIQGDEAKVLRLYEWVRAHVVAGTPPGLPVVDDHVWNILVRGYGEPDQLADVLATLCAYAGIPAELAMLGPPGGRVVHAVAMVKLDGRWRPLDPFYGVVVRHADGRLMSREELLADPNALRHAAPGLTVHGLEYPGLYAWLPQIAPGAELRPYRHMPLWRAWYQVKRTVGRITVTKDAALLAGRSESVRRVRFMPHPTDTAEGEVGPPPAGRRKGKPEGFPSEVTGIR